DVAEAILLRTMRMPRAEVVTDLMADELGLGRDEAIRVPEHLVVAVAEVLIAEPADPGDTGEEVVGGLTAGQQRRDTSSHTAVVGRPVVAELLKPFRARVTVRRMQHRTRDRVGIGPDTQRGRADIELDVEIPLVHDVHGGDETR